MQDFKQEYSLFQKALNIEDPWFVVDYELNQEDLILDIYLDFKRGAEFVCSHCGHPHAKVHDILTDDRSWRHLDFWQYRTILHARLPRTKCTLCNKIRTIHVDWSRSGAGFTWFFESEQCNL